MIAKKAFVHCQDKVTHIGYCHCDGLGLIIVACITTSVFVTSVFVMCLFVCLFGCLFVCLFDFSFSRRRIKTTDFNTCMCMHMIY
eukprot:m.76105 g.76105  ORF g.76105 m.76105 type:complete len:85 (+) comp11867_c1_seq3:1259-1513(+)